MLADPWQHVTAEFRAHLRVLSPPSVLDSAAIVRQCTACIGNDTGVVNVAAACEVLTVVLMGNRGSLGHDPDMKPLNASSLSAISIDDALRALTAIAARGSSTRCISNTAPVEANFREDTSE